MQETKITISFNSSQSGVLQVVLKYSTLHSKGRKNQLQNTDATFEDSIFYAGEGTLKNSNFSYTLQNVTHITVHPNITKTRLAQISSQNTPGTAALTEWGTC